MAKLTQSYAHVVSMTPLIGDTIGDPLAQFFPRQVIFKDLSKRRDFFEERGCQPRGSRESIVKGMVQSQCLKSTSLRMAQIAWQPFHPTLRLAGKPNLPRTA